MENKFLSESNQKIWVKAPLIKVKLKHIYGVDQKKMLIYLPYIHREIEEILCFGLFVFYIRLHLRSYNDI